MSYIKQALESSRKYYEERADRDIEINRKGNFKIVINGKACENTKLSYRLKRIDFDFGCNIFMLGQYDDENKENTYLEEWKKVFNTAVVPLYWEGTEPKRNLLRYSADVDNNVYRRPPVDMVVNYCRENDIKLKGHPLFWQEFIPDWLPENWDELYPLIEKRFKEISERSQTYHPIVEKSNL